MGCGASAVQVTYEAKAPQVNVSVCTLAGRSLCCLPMGPEMTVRELKKAIHKEGGPPAELQLLTCADRNLEDDETCSSLGWRGDVCLCVLSKSIDIDAHLASLQKTPPSIGSSALMDILTLGEEILSKEPSLLELEGPITLCGSILGDLPHLQSIWMAHADGGLLFLGEYKKDSDSGAHDVEVWILLLLLKIKHPDRIWLLRGAHELRNSSFRTECIRRYNLPASCVFWNGCQWLL